MFTTNFIPFCSPYSREAGNIRRSISLTYASFPKVHLPYLEDETIFIRSAVMETKRKVAVTT